MTPFEAGSPDSLHFQPNIDDWAEEMASSNGLSKDEDPEISESELAQVRVNVSASLIANAPVSRQFNSCRPAPCSEFSNGAIPAWPPGPLGW